MVENEKPNENGDNAEQPEKDPQDKSYGDAVKKVGDRVRGEVARRRGLQDLEMVLGTPEDNIKQIIKRTFGTTPDDKKTPESDQTSNAKNSRTFGPIEKSLPGTKFPPEKGTGNKPQNPPKPDKPNGHGEPTSGK